MSKVGKKPIEIPEGVSVSCDDTVIEVKGPSGELKVPVDGRLFEVTIADGVVTIAPRNERLDKRARSLWGTTTSLVANAVEGVTKGYEKKLEIIGVGYRAAVEGSTLVLNVGFSHPVRYDPPEGVTVAVEKNTIKVSGISKEDVGQAAADIRAVKKPEPYKGKGIKYSDEVIRRKAGKKVAGAGA